ncbi:OmpA family protein [Ferruginibacter yonginensis]|uniref:OmpA family protein n=1 Tax=Ferruginibacter yonginensis TaxID=1310416 RepID=A0ABV8QQX0_9BACT
MNRCIRLSFTFYIFIFTLPLVTQAQWYNPDKVNKKAATIFEKAYQEAIEGKYNESITHVSEAIKIDPQYLDAYYARASVYTIIKNYKAAVGDYEAAIQKDTVYAREYYLSYAIVLAGNGQFEKALAFTNKFLAIPNLNEQNKKAGNTRKKSFEFALQFAAAHQNDGYTFNPINMGDSINSGALEYLPSITVDGNKMIFNRRINGDEDFYESIKVNGVWQNALPVAGKLNTNLNEGAQNISQDGEWLIFTGCNYPEGYGSCDLYISYKNKNGTWSEAVNLGSNINTNAWESAPSLSPDKRDLYFSSTRPGGFGGSDIWVSHRNANGSWSSPENLGPTVNTSGDDGCAFMHADNQTLYFNSNGHQGYGQSDLFVTHKNQNGTWQTPQNLGYPINTIDDEGSLVVAADGITAYYASDKANNNNGLDLYSFNLPKAFTAHKTWWVKGKIFDKKTNIGLPSTVELATIDAGWVVSTLQTDEEGNYLTTLPQGENYAFSVNRKGYLFYSENFSLQNNIADSVYTINIALQPLEKSASITLKNIFFESKLSTLQTASFTELNKVVDLLKDNSNLTILISGYTDNVGKPADNIVLSQKRAQAVIDYLISKGIDGKRLTGKGFGENNPVGNNNTEVGKAQNRRTTLSVISN